MPVLSKRGLRKLHKVLEDWISEDWGDSSDSDFEYPPRSVITMRTTEDKKSDAASSSASDHPGTSSEDERMSSRMSTSSSSAATDHLPPPPKYESVIQRPVKDYTGMESSWDRDVNQIVDDFDRKCSSSLRDRERFSTLPNAKRTSSGAQSYVHEETTSRRSLSPPRSNSALAMDRDFDWDRSLLSNDGFFRDSRLRQRRPFGDRPFGGVRSAFGEDIDRFFGRGTFSTDWDTFFPEISLSNFGRGSSLASRNQSKGRELQPAKRVEDFKVEVDVEGFEPHELLVKTVGQSLLVMARSEVSNGEGKGTNRKHEFRELRREFTIPSNVNPTDITSNLTPEGVLVIEAPSSDKLSILPSDDRDKNEINDGH